MEIRPNAWLALVLSLGIFCGDTADCSEQAIFVHSNQEYTLEVYRIEPTPNSLLKFEISSSDGGRIEILPGFSINEIEDMRVHAGNVAAIIRQHNSQQVAVWSLQSRKLIDIYFSYFATFSNSGRYICFKLFYPRGLTLNEKISIYDLSLTPEQNRYGSASSGVEGSVNYSDFENPSWAAGFPLSVVDGLKGTENTYEIDAVNDSNSAVFISEIFWASDDSAVGFLASNHNLQDISLRDIELVIVEPGSADFPWKKMQVALLPFLKDRGLSTTLSFTQISISISPHRTVFLRMQNPAALVELSYQEISDLLSKSHY